MRYEPIDELLDGEPVDEPPGGRTDFKRPACFQQQPPAASRSAKQASPTQSGGYGGSHGGQLGIIITHAHKPLTCSARRLSFRYRRKSGRLPMRTVTADLTHSVDRWASAFAPLSGLSAEDLDQ